MKKVKDLISNWRKKAPRMTNRSHNANVVRLFVNSSAFGSFSNGLITKDPTFDNSQLSKCLEQIESIFDSNMSVAIVGWSKDGAQNEFVIARADLKQSIENLIKMSKRLSDREAEYEF